MVRTMRLGTDTETPERFVPETMREMLVAAEHLARYRWAAGLTLGRRVLDAGCGVGYGSALLAEAGAEDVVGVDVAAAVVEAASKDERPGLSFTRADVGHLPFPDGSFDLITCFELIEHVEDAAAVLGELARVLAPGGVLAISSPNRDRYPPGNPHHVREFSTGELRALLAEAFPDVRVLVQHQWISSAVMEEEHALGDGPGELRATTAAPRGAGSETYTVALAGRGPLPEPPPVAVFTDTVEFRRWIEHFDDQQKILADQATHLENLRQLERDRADLRAQLIAAETELARLQDWIADTLHAHREKTERLEDTIAVQRGDLDWALPELARLESLTSAVWRSLSWRVTKPLRAAKRLRRGRG